MNLRFIPDGPALLVSNRQRVLVVADLHIGIEAELAARGWHVASRTEERLGRLLACIGATDPDLLLLLGDVKHNLPKTTRQEFYEVPQFLSAVRDHVPVQILPGNHDTNIARFLKPGELLNKSGMIIDGTGYLHGHTALAPGLRGHLVIAGHHHPLVAINDEVGCALRSPAYLLAGLNTRLLFDREDPGPDGQETGAPVAAGATRVLLVPAFNECAGFDVMRIIRHPFSPISRAILPESAEVFLTDGTYIGPVSSLEGGDSAA